MGCAGSKQDQQQVKKKSSKDEDSIRSESDFSSKKSGKSIDELSNLSENEEQYQRFADTISNIDDLEYETGWILPEASDDGDSHIYNKEGRNLPTTETTELTLDSTVLNLYKRKSLTPVEREKEIIVNNIEKDEHGNNIIKNIPESPLINSIEQLISLIEELDKTWRHILEHKIALEDHHTFLNKTSTDNSYNLENEARFLEDQGIKDTDGNVLRSFLLRSSKVRNAISLSLALQQSFCECILNPKYGQEIVKLTNSLLLQASITSNDDLQTLSKEKSDIIAYKIGEKICSITIFNELLSELHLFS